MYDPQDSTLDNEQDVWRYSSFPAFLSLLQRRQLYFPSLATVRKMDQFEGKLNSQALAKYKERLPSPGAPQPQLGVNQSLVVDTLRNELCDIVCINCWHENEVESAAMWKIYSGSEGVAVRSSIGRLKDALKPETSPVYIQRIEYGDGETDSGNIIEWWRKRRSFAHEREIRMTAFQESGTAPGRYVDVDAEILVRAIRISPSAPSWLVDVVKDATVKYGLNVRDVRQSNLLSSDLH